MAKQFGGFTPEQLGKIDPAMAGMQADEQVKYMAANPGVSSRVGNMAQQAMKRISLANGGVVKAATGNLVAADYTNIPKTVTGTPVSDTTNSDPVGGLNMGSTTGDGGSTLRSDLNDKNLKDAYGNPIGVTTQGDTQAAAATAATTAADATTAGTTATAGTAAATTAGTTAATLEEKIAQAKAQEDSAAATDTSSTVSGGFANQDVTLYSGEFTEDLVNTMLKMATGQMAEDLQYDFNGDGKVTSEDSQIAAVKASEQGNYYPEGTYDPRKGLPTFPKLDLTGLDLSSLLSPSIQDGEAQKVLSSPSAFKNPASFTLEKEGNYWHMVYTDGTKISTDHRDEAQAKAASEKFSSAVVALKETDQLKPYVDQIKQYDTNIEIYKKHTAAKSSKSLEDPNAAVVAATKKLANDTALLQAYSNQLAGMEPNDPQKAILQELINKQQVQVNQTQSSVSQAKTVAGNLQSAQRAQNVSDFENDPAGQVTKADVALTSEAQRLSGMIADGTGQADENAEQATADTVIAAEDVAAASEYDATKMTAKQAADEVSLVMERLTAATGKPGSDALADAATMTPDQLSQLGISPAQLSAAQKVVAPAALTAKDGELLTGSSVDYAKAKEEVNFTAVTGVPSSDATVKGQLTSLMADFEGGNPPAWAAGALRGATAAMAARGLSASSMAGQALVQAAMEAALPIAMQDAQTVASFEAQNLSNKQQTAMFAAEQRAKFLGMDFDQAFQARVQKASRLADVANMNFSAEQQIALENSKMAQTVDIANLDAQNAKVLADSAALSQLDLANLNNRQQANVENASTFLKFNMANLTNIQQVAMFKAQSISNSLLSDTAAVNAGYQFNASSENQVDMFFSNLQTQIKQTNQDQENAMSRFTAGEANAIAQFNASQQNNREQFNATQSLIVEQANAQWDQAIVTADNAATNQANRDEASAANAMTKTAYEGQLQKERDEMSFSFQTANNNADRATTIAVQNLANDAATTMAEAEASAGMSAAIGQVIGAVITGG